MLSWAAGTAWLWLCSASLWFSWNYSSPRVSIFLLLSSLLGCIQTWQQPQEKQKHCFYFLVSLFFFCLFRASPAAHGASQSRGWIGAVAAGPCHRHSNARAPTHWVGPGLKPAFSWILVRFVSAAPQRELLLCLFLRNDKNFPRGPQQTFPCVSLPSYYLNLDWVAYYKRWFKEVLKLNTKWRLGKFPLWLSRLRTQRCLCEYVGLIPGFTQWVKDPALPQAAV